MQGYADRVAMLHHQVDSGTTTASVAVAEAKRLLCERIHTAVHNSIGYKGAAQCNGTKQPPVYTKEVRMAVRTKQVAAQAAANATPDTMQEAQAALSAASMNVKSAVKHARQQLHDRRVNAVYECRSRHDGKGMWSALKKLGNDKPRTTGPTALQGTDGSLVMGHQQVVDLLAKQFATATNSERFAQDASFDNGHKHHIEACVDTLRTHTSYREAGEECLSDPVQEWEVQGQCKRLHNWKSPNPKENINNELIKYGGTAMGLALTAFFDMQFQLETKAQTPGVIKALHKKDDPTLASNYRPITLGSTLDKLYNSVLNARICRYLEDNAMLHEAQQGFRPGRSAVDSIFMLTQCLSARMRAKLDTYILFLDIEKAYDSVWRAGLLWHVWNKGIKGKMFRVLAGMIDSPTSIVLHNGTYSAPFHPDMGWEQGDTLATTMFNIHVDAVLQEVWQHHEGVPLPNAQGLPPGKLTALMYADDLAGTATSPDALQRLIDSIKAALTKWRLKASVKPTDGSKTAVMVVRGGSKAARQRAARAGAAQHGTWKWGDTIIPQVREYRYLGVWLSDVGTWDQHLQQRMQKAQAAARAQHAIMQQRSLPWHVRKLTLVSVVQPVLTYACQVWCDTTNHTRNMLDKWQASIVKSMTHCPPTASIECIRRELGIMPLHMACDMWMLAFWHRLRNMQSDTLLHQVFSAWSGPANPWQVTINKLLAEYDIDAEGTETLNKSKFVEMVRTSVLHKLQGGADATRQQGAVYQRYVGTFGTGHSNHNKPSACGYISTLSNMHRGKAAELCMQLRTECLQLKALHSHQRRNEDAMARTSREKCPACQQAPETTHHFLLECPAYSANRTMMFNTLRATMPQQLAAIQSRSPEQAWRLLLSDAVLGKGPTQPQRQLRQPLGIQWCMQHTTQQQPQQAPQAGNARQRSTARQRPRRQHADQQPGLSAMEAVATYVVDAWKLRCAALAGRGTNGGDSMV
jgi:hypothetical protein